MEDSSEIEPKEAGKHIVSAEAIKSAGNNEWTEQSYHTEGDSMHIGSARDVIINSQSKQEQQLTFEQILLDVDVKTKAFLQKDKLCSFVDKNEMDEYANILLENHIIYIASDSKDRSIPLLYYFYSIHFGKDKKLKTLFFGENKEKSYYTFSDLIKVCENEENLFIIANLFLYRLNENKDLFLQSLNDQLNETYLSQLKKRNIFLALIVTEKKGWDVIDSTDITQRTKNVWFVQGNQVDNSEVPQAGTVFNELNFIEKLVLFIAACFDNLTFRDFDRVVGLLLAASSQNKNIVIDTFKNFDDGAKKVKHVSEKKLIDVWDENKDYFFNNCYLEGKDDGGVYIVGFKYPELKNSIFDYLKINQHFFWQNQCTILEESRLVFNPNVSEAIASGVVNLIIESLSDDVNYYNEFWFLGIIQEIKYADGQEYVIKGNTAKEQLTNLFLGIEERKDLVNLFYRRLGNILKKMLKKNLGQKVQDFLGSLIDFKLYQQLLVLVKMLGNSEGFDKFFWLKQVIERGDVETKNDAYRWLINIASNRYADETWGAIKLWLPGEKKISTYSPSNHYASFFIVHFYVNEVCALEFSSFGVWPSKFSLFANYDSEPEKCREHLKLILKRYVHEGTAYQFSNDNMQLVYQMTLELFALNWSYKVAIQKFLFMNEDNYLDNYCLKYTPNFYTLIADILETWFHILQGFEAKVAKEKQPLVDFFIGTMIKEAKESPVFFNGIIKHLERKAGEYNHQLNRLTTQMVKQKSEIEEKELVIMELFKNSLKQRGENMILLFNEITKHL